MHQSKAPGRPYCYGCKHYYVTWDNRFPCGCRAYGIKSKHFPATEVLRATGQRCLCYQAKVEQDQPKSKSDQTPRPKSGDKFI